LEFVGSVQGIPVIDYLLCADWSKEQKGRSLYAANVLTREVFRTEEGGLTVDFALEKARDLATRGNVLLSFDVPLGLPQSFLSALRNTPDWNDASGFIEFLLIAARTPSFFVSGRDASSWNIKKPFFVVPPGEGGKKAFEAKAERAGVRLQRKIERRTKGNPVFITSGIPGSVGSGAIDVWRGLASLLPRERDFKVWPFEGALSALFASTPIVVAENYPRAIYAAALSDLPSAQRPRLRISKTMAETRKAAMECLMSRSWIGRYCVTLKNTSAALADENSFDALLTAAGLLRVLLDDELLFSPEFEDPVAEGGILGTGTINFDLPEANFFPRGGKRTSPAGTKARRASMLPGSAMDADGHAEGANEDATVGSTYACPIRGCSKRFNGGRGGWDGHVGSLTNHPNWHSEVTSPKDRVELFRAEFPLFFSKLDIGCRTL
jgi:hypothetical protein